MKKPSSSLGFLFKVDNSFWRITSGGYSTRVITNLLHYVRKNKTSDGCQKKLEGESESGFKTWEELQEDPTFMDQMIFIDGKISFKDPNITLALAVKSAFEQGAISNQIKQDVEKLFKEGKKEEGL